MTTPFSYPKARHARSETPGAYADYRRYKPFLQIEFERKCVYCRTPDTMKGYEGFGVDHYRPKKKFPSFSTVYSNLFYCCNQCNTRKGEYWPIPSLETTHFIPNPCDHVMFANLQFKGAEVHPKSQAGIIAIDYLDLNDDASLEHRQLVNFALDMFESKRKEIQGLIEGVAAKRAAGEKSAHEATAARNKLQRQLSEVEANIRRLCGV